MSAMRLFCRKYFLAWCCISAIGFIPVLADAAAVGRFQFVAGSVSVIDNQGKQRAAQKGAEIAEGETLSTAENGTAQVRMIDGGIIALRPDTQLKISAYRYQGKEDGSENALFSLIRGGLRAITGAVGKTNKENYKIKTASATIGIRGTDHEAVVVLPSQANPSNGLQAGTYDKVNVGATSLTTNAGVAYVGPNQVGFAATLNQAPVVLPTMPNIFRAAPAPTAKQTPSAAKSDTQSTTTADSGVTNAESAPAVSTTGSTEPTLNNLTGVNSSGSSLNTLNQTVTTTGGSTISIGMTLVRAAGTSSEWFGGEYIYSTATSTDPNAFRGAVDGGVQLPNQVIEQGNALVGFSGKAAGFTSSGSSATSPIAPDGFTPAAIRIGTAVNQDVSSSSVAGVPVSWGRWVGGNIAVYSADGSTLLGKIDNTSRSLHWVTIGSVPSNFLQPPLTGTASYTVLGSTNPTDLIGNVGTLTNATLNANFTSARANTTIDVSFNSPTNTSNWSMTANNVPISKTVDDGFRSSTALSGTNGMTHTVSCVGPSCGTQNIGSANGHFVLNGQGAVVFYTMGSGKVTSTGQTSLSTFTPSSVVTGAVLFKK
ncbi:MAG: FecR domain-containing protein [Burkholderiales bacterium]|nr:FecR domain-containing protein [Burkholderiales bacterium]